MPNPAAHVDPVLTPPLLKHSELQKFFKHWSSHPLQ
jgi:hypothetical protein